MALYANLKTAFSEQAGLLKNFLKIVLCCAVLAGCSAEYSGVYQSIDAESKWDEKARIVISNSKQELPRYVVKENKLYLLIQMTQVDWFFHTLVNYPLWDKAEVRQLVEEHADIKHLVPVDWNNWLPKGYGDECKN